jgi:hypothetical protein
MLTLVIIALIVAFVTVATVGHILLLAAVLGGNGSST